MRRLRAYIVWRDNVSPATLNRKLADIFHEIDFRRHTDEAVAAAQREREEPRRSERNRWRMWLALK